MPGQGLECRVAVQKQRLSDWLVLKATCDNAESCSYEYLGSALDECEEGYLADYMQIYYICGTGKCQRFMVLLRYTFDLVSFK